MIFDALWSRLSTSVKTVKTEAVANAMTHDYTSKMRGWGHDIMYTVVDEGRQLQAMGWGYNIKRGDYILLSNEQRYTRYRVGDINYFRDPSDMWQATLIFDPRKSRDDS